MCIINKNITCNFDPNSLTTTALIFLWENYRIFRVNNTYSMHVTLISHDFFFFFSRNRPGRSNIYIIFLQLLHFVKNRTSYILISLKLVPKKKKNGAIEGCSQLLHYSRNLESSSTNSFWNPQQRILNPQDKEKFWNFMNLSN